MTQIKELVFEEDARLKLRDGVAKLTDVVGVTLGPMGRPIGLEENWGTPTITSDGYTIVKNIEFKDQFLNMGASIAKEAAASMKEKCGDGTTTTLLLLRSLVDHALKNIGAGTTPIEIKRGMEKGAQAILQELDKLSKPISNLEEIVPIAISSASGDREIGSMVAEALQKVGRGGVVTIEEGKSIESTLEMTPGMQLDRGYLSPYFCTNTDAQLVELHDSAVLITDSKIGSIQEIISLVHAVATTGRALFIIADDLQGDALSTLVINKLRGTLKVCAIKAPGFGESRAALLQDIAVLTGATVITEDVGLTLTNATVDLLGSAEKIIVSKDTTTLISSSSNPMADPVAVKERLKLLDAQILLEKNSHDKEKLLKRKAQLSGGIAVIRVGAVAEPEMKRKKQMFEDSLNSTQSAIEEGIVPGGGVALLRACFSLKNFSLKGDEQIGAHIVIKACEAPFRQIVKNTGYDSSLYLEKVLSKENSWGFNALTEQVEDLLVSGVIDPTKVVKHSLMMALSAAGIILLSEVLMGHAAEE